MSILKKRAALIIWIPLTLMIIGGLINLFIQYNFFENKKTNGSTVNSEIRISSNIDSQEIKEFTDAIRELNFTLKNSNLTNKPKPARNEIWFIITSSSILFLLGLVLLIMLLFDKKSSFLNRIKYGFIIFSVFIALGLISLRITDQVPLILSSTWFLNYVVYCLIQYVIIGLSIVLVDVFSDYILGPSESSPTSSPH